MAWRILLLLALPIHLSLASQLEEINDPEKAAISPSDIMFGGIWLKAHQNSSASLEDLPQNRFVKHYELVPKYDAKKIEGDFFQFLTGSNRLVMLGVLNTNLKLFVGAPGKLNRKELRNFAEPDNIKEVRFASVAKSVKDALAQFAKGQGFAATQFQELQLHELGAYSVVSMRLDPELSAVQLFQLMNAILRESHSCKIEISDWNTR